MHTKRKFMFNVWLPSLPFVADIFVIFVSTQLTKIGSFAAMRALVLWLIVTQPFLLLAMIVWILSTVTRILWFSTVFHWYKPSMPLAEYRFL
jgi:hypothetical protein